VGRRLASFGLLLVLACSPAKDAAGPQVPTSPTLPAPPTLPTRTAEPGSPQETFAFAVKGDWGAGTSWQRAVTRRICEQMDRIGFRDVLTVGDNFYDPDGTATRRTYGDPERCLRERNVRWRPAWGNHDVAGMSTRDVLRAPGRWYAWRAPGVAFFTLDSTQVTSRRQRSWLIARLREETAPVKIVSFHHPPFTVGGPHQPDRTVRREWVPLFERYDVTLVLNGHQHVYEHHRVRGVDYVVTGGGGAWLYRCGRVVAPTLRCRSRHHSLLVLVRGTQVRVRAVGLEQGQLVDDFTIDAA
jgi:hypothetical protein